MASLRLSVALSVLSGADVARSPVLGPALVIKSAFPARQHGPYRLLPGVCRLLLVPVQKLLQGLQFFISRRTSVDIPNRGLDRHVAFFYIHQLRGQHLLAVAQQFIFDLVSVAEQERLIDADLKLLAWIFQRSGEIAPARLYLLDPVIQL